MVKNFIFKKIVKNFFKGKQKSSECGEINPRRDWNIILVFFATATIVLIIFGSYMYWGISRGSLFVVSGGKESPIDTINRSELKKTVDYYEAKNRLFEEAKTTKPQVIDPSL